MEVIFKKIDHRVPEILKIIEDDLDYYSAIHIQLSKLQKQNQSLYQSKMAANLIYEIMADYQGWLVFFLDYDLVCVFKNINSSDILKSLVARIREIFVADPLAYFSNGLVNPDFATIYEFPFNYKYFKNQLEGKLPKQAPKNLQILANANANKTVSIHDLLDIEKKLLDVDINNIIRKQSVCGLLNNKKALKPVFNEIHISMPKLARILSVNFEEGIHKSLMQYLEEVLQKKLLEYLIKDSRILLGGPFSINMTISIVMSELFNKFDKIIKDKIEHPVIIELATSDLFSDMRASLQAINYVKGLGYKVCIKGINETNIQILDREIFKADFGKIYWNEELVLSRQNVEFNKFKNAIDHYGPGRLIINNCNSFEVIELGKKIGINLFQGWECDQMLKNKTIEILELV